MKNTKKYLNASLILIMTLLMSLPTSALEEEQQELKQKELTQEHQQEQAEVKRKIPQNAAFDKPKEHKDRKEEQLQLDIKQQQEREQVNQ